MTTKTLIVSLLLLFVSVPSRAARCGVREDSCTVREAESAFRPREAFRRNFSYMGIPLVVSGVLVMPDNDDFRKLRNRFIPKFHNEYDNYTQTRPNTDKNRKNKANSWKLTVMCVSIPCPSSGHNILFLKG